jgi:sugar fermentation stimulation protein A
MDYGELQSGTLLRRYKRFLADVELADGRTITAHCPNTGAMTGCAEPGSRVWLLHSKAPGRKYPYGWELVETATGTACIHSARANRVVAEAFAAGRIPGFEAYPQQQREVRYGRGSRADLVLSGEAGQVIIEVKSVTLCRPGGWGAFPDAVSERARKHLAELQAVRTGTTRAMIFFCVLHTGVQRVCAARDIDPRYAEALEQALDAGVEVQAWGAQVSPAGISLVTDLPFALDP